MTIQEYSKEVLVYNERLILPGMGCIKIARQTARVKGKKLTPPGAGLIFDPSESMDDEVLSKKISEAEDTSIEEARQRVLEFVDEIRFALDQGEKYSMEGFCTFFRNDDNEIVIEKDPGLDLSFESFGLDSFELEDFEGEEEAEEIEKEFTGNEIVTAEEVEQGGETGSADETKNGDFSGSTVDTGSASEKETGDVPEVHKEDDAKARVDSETEPEPEIISEVTEKTGEESSESIQENVEEKKEATEVWDKPPEPVLPVYESHYRRRRKKKKTWIILSSILIFLLLAIIIIPIKTDLLGDRFDIRRLFKDEELNIDDDFTDAEEGEFSFDRMVNELESDIDSATSPENALGIKPGNQAEVNVNEADYTEYHIIAGSFRDLENAQELQKSLSLEGYPSLIIKLDNGIYRVSVISFRDKATALNKLVEFRAKSGMSEAWLMNLE